MSMAGETGFYMGKTIMSLQVTVIISHMPGVGIIWEDGNIILVLHNGWHHPGDAFLQSSSSARYSLNRTEIILVR